MGGCMNLMLRRRAMMASGPKEQPNYLCFTALESGTFTLTIGASVTTSNLSYVEYSLDGNTWVKTNNANSTTITVTTPTIANGGKVYWRGSGVCTAINQGSTTSTPQNVSVFTSTCKFNLSGELYSMIFGKSYDISQTNRRYAFCALFSTSKVVDASELVLRLPSDTEGFMNLFLNCTELVTPPSLDMLTINQGCFQYMFDGCSSLTTAPALPATTLAGTCYQYMFRNCTSLTTAPALPATELPGYCYSNMFNGCTALVNVPDINVMSFTGGYSMTYMFRNCTSLTHCPVKSVPDTLQAGSMSEMFYNCTNLLDICTLPALTLTTFAYRQLIRGTKVSYIKMLATDISASNCLANWVTSVPNVNTSVFVKHIDAQWTTTGNSGVPTNWTVIYYDPALDKYYLDQQRSQECDDHGNPI